MQKEEYKNIFNLEKNHFWYKANRELSLDLIRKSLPGKSNTILDAGCGTGGTTRFLSTFGKVTGIDYHPLAVTLARKNGISAIRGSTTHLPFLARKFDIVTSFDVLYHKNVNPHSALREFFRVLKPGGLLLIRVPAFQFLYGPHDDIVHTGRRYTLPQLKFQVSSSGFHIKSIFYFNFTLFFPALLKRSLFKSPSSDISHLPSWLNGLLYKLLKIESKIVQYIHLPFGVSIYCLAQKHVS